MSLVHRRAGVLLSALLLAALAACGDNNAPRGEGGDDDEDGAGSVTDAGGGTPDGGDGPDAGGKPDGGGNDGGGDRDAGGSPDGGDRDGGGAPDGGDSDAGTPDAGTPDAGTPDAGEPDAGTPDAGEPDAAPDELDGEFLLAIAADLAPTMPIRFITTVDFTPTDGGAGTAIFVFQPIIAENCAAGMGGLPVGDPTTTPPIDISADGAFQIALNELTLPEDANTILCSELTADVIEVSGTVQSPDLTCGDVTVTAGTLVLQGTFGAIRIPPGTIGDENLPDPVTSCP